MRIAYLAYTPMPSNKASGVNILKMCQAFAELGHEVRLYNPRILPCATTSDLATFYGIGESFSICRLPRPRNRLKGLIRYTRSYRSSIQSFRPDLLYIRDHGAKIYIPCRLKTRKIFEAHLLHLDSPYIQDLEKDPYLRQFVVISSALKHDYAQHYPGLLSQLSVHHDGANLTTLPDSSVNSIFLKSQKVNVAYIGNLYPGKGMELIQKLLPIADFCHFHIIGGQGDELELWQERCSDSENITFYGFLSPAVVESMRTQFDCFLAPFQLNVMIGPGTDAAKWMSPLKIFEYMASGKLIIASDLPVIREVLEHEFNALLCRPDNPLEWLSALRRVRDEQERCAEIAENALEVIRTKYTWLERARQILKNELAMQ